MSNHRRKRIPVKAIRHHAADSTKNHLKLVRFDNNQDKKTHLDVDYCRNEQALDDTENAKQERYLAAETQNANARTLIDSLPKILLGCIASSTMLTTISGNLFWLLPVLLLWIIYIVDLLVASLFFIRKK